MFISHPALAIHSPAWPSPSKAFLGCSRKWSWSDGKKEEEHIGLPPLGVSFPLDLPITMEEEVIVKD